MFDRADERNRVSNNAELEQFTESVEQENRPNTRPRNVRYQHVLERTFNNAKDCQDFIDNEKCWKVHDTSSQKSGVKTIYWCNRVKCRGERCLAELYTIRDQYPGDNAILLYRRNQAHTCETASNKVNDLSDEMKKCIEKYVDMRMTPKPMIQRLRIDLPNDPADKKQILSYYKKYRKQLFGKANTSVEDMVTFLCGK